MMREKLLAVGDDFWIEDDDGNKVFKVNGKAARLRETFILEDPSGREVSKIQEKKLSVRDKMTIELGDTQATVHKRLIGIRDHYVIEVDGGKDLKAHGNIVDHEYEIERDGDTVATVSKKWFRAPRDVRRPAGRGAEHPADPGDHGLRRRDGARLTRVSAGWFRDGRLRDLLNHRPLRKAPWRNLLNHRWLRKAPWRLSRNRATPAPASAENRCRRPPRRA